jgi:hypothetical protein
MSLVLRDTQRLAKPIGDIVMGLEASTLSHVFYEALQMVYSFTFWA